MLEENLNNELSKNTGECSDQSPAQLPQPSQIEQLEAKIAELEKNLSFYKDQFLRKMAEFDNYKKRMDAEYVNFIKFANETFIEKLLPVIDDFERSLKAIEEYSARENNKTKENQSLFKGVELIYHKLLKVLESHGVTRMEVLNKPFDPNLHDALMQVESKDQPHHTVIQEVEKGYLLHDKVIRHAKVIVSSLPEEENKKQSEKTEEGNENG